MHNYAPVATTLDSYPLDFSTSSSRGLEYERRKTDYTISFFTERTNPELALAAQQVQGECYLEAHYISEQDLDEYGRLNIDLDKARGDNVEYLVAEKDGRVKGAVRLVSIPDGGTILDLPAYEKSVQDMDPDFRYLLEQAYEDDKSRGVLEVAGLSRSKDAPPTVLLEMIREIVQRAVRARSEEVWIVTATDNSFNMIQSRFGKNVINPIGPRVPVISDDIGTREYLQPSLIVPGTLIESVMSSVANESDIMQKRRLMKTLDFMVDGLDNNEYGGVLKDALDLTKYTELGLR